MALLLVLSGTLIAVDHAGDAAGLAVGLALFAATTIVLGQLLPRAVARRFAPGVASLSVIVSSADLVIVGVAGACAILQVPPISTAAKRIEPIILYLLIDCFSNQRIFI